MRRGFPPTFFIFLIEIFFSRNYLFYADEALPKPFTLESSYEVCGFFLKYFFVF
jgi:hypothetical protein